MGERREELARLVNEPGSEYHTGDPGNFARTHEARSAKASANRPLRRLAARGLLVPHEWYWHYFLTAEGFAVAEQRPAVVRLSLPMLAALGVVPWRHESWRQRYQYTARCWQPPPFQLRSSG